MRKSGAKRPLIGHLCLFRLLLMATPPPNIRVSVVRRRQTSKESRELKHDGQIKAFILSQGMSWEKLFTPAILNILDGKCAQNVKKI